MNRVKVPQRLIDEWQERFDTLEGENEELKREAKQVAEWVDEVKATGITDHPAQALTAWQRMCRWSEAIHKANLTSS